MTLVERRDGWVVEEWSWWLAATMAAFAAGCFWFHHDAYGALGFGYPPGVWDSWWFIAGHVYAVLAVLLIEQRRWWFDFERREVRLETRGVLSRRRVVPFGDLRRLGAPERPVQDEGRASGALVLCHAHGLERYRNWASSSDHAKVVAISERLNARLGLHRMPADAMAREMLANGAVGGAIDALALFGDLSMMAARQEVQRRGALIGAEPSTLDLLREAFRTLSLGQMVLLLLLSPLLLLVLAFGRKRERRI